MPAHRCRLEIGLVGLPSTRLTLAHQPPVADDVCGGAAAGGRRSLFGDSGLAQAVEVALKSD